MRRLIPNSALSLDNIPGPSADWDTVAVFASSFDAYAHWEEPWEHSDWSEGIPVDEYVEMIRRRRLAQPVNKVFEVHDQLSSHYREVGRWQGTLSELRTCLFVKWRFSSGRTSSSQWLLEVQDLLNAIRAEVLAGRLG
jgi:hypothetical protein